MSIKIGPVAMRLIGDSARQAAAVVNLRSRLFVLLAAISLLGSVQLSPAAAEPDQRTLRWLQEVLLGPEYGGDGRRCARWTRQPTLSTYYANREQSELVADVVAELNDVLSQTSIGGIALLAPQHDAADIRVYFVPLSRFPSLAAQLGFPYSNKDIGYFWDFWDDSHRIQRAYVLLASDRLKGRQLRHFALEEITQSLGPMSDSSIYPQSAFYANGDDGGDAQHLGALDRKALHLLYAWLRPGADRDELLTAVRDYWPD